MAGDMPEVSGVWELQLTWSCIMGTGRTRGGSRQRFLFSKSVIFSLVLSYSVSPIVYNVFAIVRVYEKRNLKKGRTE